MSHSNPSHLHEAVSLLASPSPLRRVSNNAKLSTNATESGKPLPKPVIKSSVDHHVITNTNFTLVCEQSALIESLYHIAWEIPSRDEVSKTEDEIEIIGNTTHLCALPQNRINITTAETDPKTRNSTHQLGRSILTVLNAKRTDSGLYTCITTDKSQNTKYFVRYMIKVLGGFNNIQNSIF